MFLISILAVYSVAAFWKFASDENRFDAISEKPDIVFFTHSASGNGAEFSFEQTSRSRLTPDFLRDHALDHSGHCGMQLVHEIGVLLWRPTRSIDRDVNSQRMRWERESSR
jgi:hypothetical protein